MTPRALALSLLTCLPLSLSGAQAPKPSDPFSTVAFLIGNWETSDPSGPGRNKGTFSIQRDLGGTILLRRDHTDYGAVGQRPAGSLDVMMTIFPDPADASRLRAMFFDSEGHVIPYLATNIQPGKSVRFTSEPSAGQPGFRLTYARESDDALHVKFEIAPPNTPGVFTTYAEGSAHRRR